MKVIYSSEFVLTVGVSVLGCKEQQQKTDGGIDRDRRDISTKCSSSFSQGEVVKQKHQLFAGLEKNNPLHWGGAMETNPTN